jgi:ABC-2 type transport system ATP-binding protein
VTSPTPAIEAEGLIKSFGATTAVDHLDLTVPSGQVYGVLGPNGAGKTTAVRLLATLLQPDGGHARVLGHDLVTEGHRIRARVSLTGQFASVDEDLTGLENLVLLARLLGHTRRGARRRAVELLESFDLESAGARQVKGYSGGMRRRLDIAASIVAQPQLIFLDEPTTGLDPRSRSQVWDLVRALVAEGTTVVLTTQYLEEADQLADSIAIIERGRVVAEGTARQLKASVGSGALHVRLQEPTDRPRAERALARALQAPVHLEADPVALTVGVADPGAVARALSELDVADIPVSDVAVGQPSLDEVFLALTGHTASDADLATA